MNAHTEKWEKECVGLRRSVWLRKIRLMMFGIKKQDYLLDLGCGDGLNIKILRALGIKNIVGLDISKSLLNLAQKNNPGIKFVLGFAEKLPFKDESFDGVLVDSTFHHLSDYKKSIRQINRILKKGGFLYFSEPHNSFLRNVYDFLTVRSIGRIPLFSKRRMTFLAEEELIKNWLMHEEFFIESLKPLGFRKIYVKYDLLSIIGKFKKMSNQ